MLDQVERRCAIGFYQDEVGAHACKICPRGSICPYPGMQAPIPCPSGFTCEYQGLSSPSSECPAGEYCLAGTHGTEPFHNGHIPRSSYLCSSGSYCRPGMKTGVAVLHSNSSAPSPCALGMVCSEGSAQLGGEGPCPSGHFCPTPRHTGIPCPPRNYCPKRGNSLPIKCPRGTFNMHFG
jgi:hypothetical protein